MNIRYEKIIDLLYHSVIEEGGDGDAIWLIKYPEFSPLEKVAEWLVEYNTTHNTGWKAFIPTERPAKISIIEVKKDMEKSWLLSVKRKNGELVDIWIPKSKCSIKDNVLSIPRWLLRIKNKELNVKTSSPTGA